MNDSRSQTPNGTLRQYICFKLLLLQALILIVWLKDDGSQGQSFENVVSKSIISPSSTSDTTKIDVEHSTLASDSALTSSYPIVVNDSSNTSLLRPSKNKSNSVITNDIPWKDNKTNKILETERGGKITKINNQYYWIGTTPGYLLIYQSYTLGSDSWTLVKKIKLPKDKNTSYKMGGCQLRQHPVYHTNHIFCKRRRWFIQQFSNDDEKKDLNNEDAVDPTIGTYKLLPIPNDPSSIKYFHLGGQSTFLDEEDNNTLYFLVFRSHHNEPNSRTLYIYKFNDKWDDFDQQENAEIVHFKWRGRESPWMFKRNGLYYLIVSQTRGWQQSKTMYRVSTSILGLKDAEEKQVVMHPHDNNKVKSMGSQFRFMMDLEYDNEERWIFVGSRYPTEGPEYWDSRYGRNVIVPMNFIDDVPHVYWKREFDWTTYDYKSGDFDHGKRKGYAPPKSPTFDINVDNIDIL